MSSDEENKSNSTQQPETRMSLAAEKHAHLAPQETAASDKNAQEPDAVERAYRTKTFTRRALLVAGSALPFLYTERRAGAAGGNLDEWHADRARTDNSHADNHSDNLFHTDVSTPSSHGDHVDHNDHIDVLHNDSNTGPEILSHTDAHADHGDIHNDHIDHIDVAHGDAANPVHTDRSANHNDRAHVDAHNDAAGHGDVGGGGPSGVHTDHTDVHIDHTDHIDVHIDHIDASHTDHIDTPHTDHVDGHNDRTHADHADATPHGDSPVPPHGDSPVPPHGDSPVPPHGDGPIHPPPHPHIDVITPSQ